MEICDIDDADTHYDLGMNFGAGKNNFEKDYTRAYGHFKNAALMGHPSAMLYLAQCYRQGKGVKKNNESYRKWVVACVGTGSPPAAALFSMGSIHSSEGELGDALDCFYQSYSRGFTRAGLAYAEIKLLEDVMFVDELFELQQIIEACKDIDQDKFASFLCASKKILTKKREVTH